MLHDFFTQMVYAHSKAATVLNTEERDADRMTIVNHNLKYLRNLKKPVPGHMESTWNKDTEKCMLNVKTILAFYNFNRFSSKIRSCQDWIEKRKEFDSIGSLHCKWTLSVTLKHFSKPDIVINQAQFNEIKFRAMLSMMLKWAWAFPTRTNFCWSGPWRGWWEKTLTTHNFTRRFVRLMIALCINLEVVNN